MSRRSISFFIAATLCLGVAFAAQFEPIQIQSETPVTVTQSGQTFEISATGITVEVQFTSVSPSLVTGIARRTGGGASGILRISWVEQGILREIRLSISEPEKLFSLEGGETDKKTGGQFGG